MKTLCLCFAIVFLFASSGCDPARQIGDIEVGSNSGGILSTERIPSAAYASLYGVELDSPNGSSARAQTLLLTVVMVPPQKERWRYAGGGSIRPWNEWIYPRRWAYVPRLYFSKREPNGDNSSRLERKAFEFEYDGRRRLVRIAGKDYAVRIGELIFIQFDSNWDPHVTLAKETLEPISISSNISQEIERKLESMSVFLTPYAR